MGEGAREQAVEGSAGGSPDAFRRLSRVVWLLCGLAFCALAFAIYWPALWGGFVADDWNYIVDNPFITPFGAQSASALFDPFGGATFYVVNYAPVHLLAHGLERAIFGSAVLGYHVVNLLVHLGVTGLLIALLRRSGVPDVAALMAGLVFLVHPANVEAVAWMSQLKTTGSTALALGALLALRRAPSASLLLFGLALLTKASALFALPMAAAFVWSWRLGARHWGWVAAWAALFALYAVPQFAAFAFGGEHVEAAYQDPFVQLRSMAAIGARYVAMATTSYGVSALQQHRPVETLADPWWLLSLPLAAWFIWRTLSCLRQRRQEAAWWLGAAAAYAPVSQLFPFIHPMADRYLYSVLPGLLGGSILCLLAWRSATGSPARLTRPQRVVALVAVALLCGGFAFRSHARAALWEREELTLQESAANYPDGVIAHSLRACTAAEHGDAEAAVASLRRAVALSPASQRNYFAQDCMGPIRDDPVFLAFAHEQARLRIAFAIERNVSTQHWLRSRANDYLILADLESALAAFEAALRAGGPRDAVVLQEIDAARRMLTAERRGEPTPQLFSIPGAAPSIEPTER